MSHTQNFIPLLGEQLFPSCGANKNKQKQIAPQAVEWKNESLHRPKTSKTNCSTGCGAEKTNHSPSKKQAKQIAPQAGKRSRRQLLNTPIAPIQPYHLLTISPAQTSLQNFMETFCVFFFSIHYFLLHLHLISRIKYPG
ncbi:MAG: hypothetical protein J6K41_00270 [Paraprevotella sp.]|nr:hypothetical protein [Paraprevotella sp.]